MALCKFAFNFLT